MPERFRPPQFLREGVEPKPLHGEEYGEGVFAVVANLENLPPSVRERVPDGYVIKQYRMSEHDWNLSLGERVPWSSAFGEWGYLLNEQNQYGAASKEASWLNLMYAVQSYAHDKGHKPTLDELHQYLSDQQQGGKLDPQCQIFLEREVLQKCWDESSLMGMAKELKRRHDLVRAYFQDSLPNLIVDTQFIVGSPDGSHEQARLYEVQKRVIPLQVWQKMLALAEESRHERYYDEESEERRRLILKDPLMRAYSIAINYYKSYGEISEDVEQDLAEAAQTITQAVRDELKDKPEKLKRLKSELRKFIPKAKMLPKTQDWVPYDLPWLDNLVFTSEGLRVIDTNQGLQPSRVVRAENKESAMEQYTHALDILREIQKNL